MKITITQLIISSGLTILAASFVPQEQPPTLLEAFKLIKNLQGEVSNLKTSLSSQKGEVSNLKTSLSSQKNDLEEQISDFKTNISDNKRETNQKISDVLLKSLPVGSIVSFGLEANNLPSGWVLCDGRKITDAGSIYDGYNVPDLRSHFIRGKSSGETLLAEYGANSHSHSISSHTHEIGSHTHSFTTNENRGGSWSTTINYITLDRPIPNGDAFTNRSQKVMWLDNSGSYDGNHSHSGTTGNASTGYTASGGGGYTGSEYNIPKYVALNYIIKIK